MKPDSPVKKVIGNVSSLWLSSLGGAGFAFLTQVVLARELNPAGYGLFAAVLATITLLAPLAGFGVPGLWLKLFGAEGWEATRWLAASFRFVLMSTALVLLALFVWAAWGPHDALSRHLYYWLLPVVAGTLSMELVSGKLQLEERYRALAIWQLLPSAARLLLVILVVSLSSISSMDGIAASYAIVAIVLTILGFVQLREMSSGRLALKGHPARRMTANGAAVRPDIASILDIARVAWPFGFAGVFYLVYFQIDIILLKYFTGSAAAGIYNVAFTVMAAVYLLPAAIYQKFLLPKFHRWAHHDRARFLQVYRVGNGSMLALGTATTVVMLLVVPFFIPRLFGPAYQSAIGLLSLLSFCAPVRFLATSVGATLVTQEHMRRKIWYMGIVAVVNLTLNLLLIPSYAAYGAAVATLASEVLLLALYLLAVRQHVFGAEAWRGWTLTFRDRNV